MSYIIGWFVLLLLLGLSTLSAFLSLGSVAPLLQFAIAVTQAGLVFVLFMRLRDAQALPRIFAGIGFFWLALLFVMTAIDYATRSGMPQP
ncbi:MAG: oxidase [Alphaproteobacteria bacterium]|nr:oxidase [Alphaproteobacteria bacterium]